MSTRLCCLITLLALGFPLPTHACTSGVACALVTVDGRPLMWKSRMWAGGGANEVRYFAAGVDNDQDGAKDRYSYLGVQSAEVRPDGSLILPMIGVNSAGLATGHNILFNTVVQADRRLNAFVLGNLASLAEVDAVYASAKTPFFAATQDLHMYMDASGKAEIWENAVACIAAGKLQGGYSCSECTGAGTPYDGTDYQYRTTAPARAKQSLSSLGYNVTLGGWVVRANNPPHAKKDGSDDLNNPHSRYQVGLAAIATLVQGKKLSAETVMSGFMRQPKLSPSSVVSSMVAHGVLPTEDARLTTMWIAMGNARTSVAVPLWVHGVEALPAGSRLPPQNLRFDTSKKTESIAYLSRYLFARGGGATSLVQARAQACEKHLFSQVTGVLLPEWRKRDLSGGAVGKEMSRVQARASKDAYSLIRSLYDDYSAGKAPGAYPPAVKIDAVSAIGLSVTVKATASTGAPAVQQGWFVDFSSAGGSTSTETSPVPGRRWTTVASKDKGAPVTLLDSSGKATAVTLEITDGFAGDTGDGQSASVLFPASAQKDAFFVGEGAGYDDRTARLAIKKLDAKKKYDVTFFGSRTSCSYSRKGYYVIGGKTVTLDACKNTANKATLSDVAPDSAGSVGIDIHNGKGKGAFAYLGVLAIVPQGGGSSGDTTGLTYTYDYGDGATGTQATHTYQKPGRYLLGCTATNKEGVSQTAWSFVTVGGAPTTDAGPAKPDASAGDASPTPAAQDDGCSVAAPGATPIIPLACLLILLALRRRMR